MTLLPVDLSDTLAPAGEPVGFEACLNFYGLTAATDGRGD